MDRFSQLLKDPIWWITAVVFTLLLNIIGNYLTPVGPNLLEKISTTIRERNVQKKAELEKRVIFLTENPDQIMDIIFRGFARAIIQSVMTIVSMIALSASMVIFAHWGAEFFRDAGVMEPLELDLSTGANLIPLVIGVFLVSLSFIFSSLAVFYFVQKGDDYYLAKEARKRLRENDNNNN